MLDDHDANASMTVRLLFISDHSTFDRGHHAVDWSIQEPDDEANCCGEPHTSRHAQVKTGGTYVVEMTVETERLIVAVDTPNSSRQSITGTRLGPTFYDHPPGTKIRLGDGKMAI